jgi:uncharacterized membrane protein
MTDNTAIPTTPPAPGLVTVTHLVYALHALSLMIGITTAATIIGAFVFGVPSIIAVVINYVKRGEARGTYLESHFRWQIRTFWFAFLWCVVGGMPFVTLVGIPLAIGVSSRPACGPSTGSLAGGWRCEIESQCMNKRTKSGRPKRLASI